MNVPIRGKGTTGSESNEEYRGSLPEEETVHVCLTVLIKCNNRSPYHRVISQLARRKTSPGFHLFDLHCRHLLSLVPLLRPSLWPSLFQPTYSSSDCDSFPRCYPELNHRFLAEAQTIKSN